jgi:transposase
MTVEHVAAIRRMIKEAAEQGPVRFEGSEALTGHSGGKLLGVLQRLPTLFDAVDVCYLEIGVFQGLTLLSVAGANRRRACFGIDNFAFFDPKGLNRGIVFERQASLGLAHAELIDADYEDALEALPGCVGGRPIGVYFVDGPHDYRSQLMCLLLAKTHLHPGAVIIVDDCNYEHVRQANRDFLRTHPDFRLLFEAYTEGHPGTISDSSVEAARAGWWNGVNIIVSDPSGILPYAEPKTRRDRTRFENDHLVHAARLAELAPESVGAADALLGGRLLRATWLFGEIWSAKRRMGAQVSKRARTRNTYSESLVGEHWNPQEASTD